MIKKILGVFFRVSFTCLIFLLSYSHQAQDLNGISPQDLNNVDINALSDQQIQALFVRMQESGLTLSQLEIIAMQKGVSRSQITKLRNRIQELQHDIRSQDFNVENSLSRFRTGVNQNDVYDSFFSGLTPQDSITPKGLQIFGFSIFKHSKMTFEPSLNAATPENYVLGAGDEVIIDVYGASEITYRQYINPDGNIMVTGVGPISLSGISIKEAKNRIFNKLLLVHSGIKGKNPDTFLHVSLGNIRTIKVNVVGNVRKPGTYNLSSFSTAFNALYFAGGPTKTGSMRKIEIIRKGKKIATLDVYKYLFEGDDSQNPVLTDQDILVIKPYIGHVKLAGHIKIPAIYELKNEESLEDLFNISGGFTGEAYKKAITIDRKDELERSIKTVLREDFHSMIPQDGDSIYVQKIMDRYANRVKIEGAIKRPGYYELTEQLTLSSLIKTAGGFREDVHKERGNIIRLNENLTLKNLAFDISSLVAGNQDILLSADDLILIPSIFDIQEKKMVTLHGTVNNPGEYPYVMGMTVEDLINVAGGLKEEASTSLVEVARKLTNNSDLSKSASIFTFSISPSMAMNGASDFELLPFDLVLVKSTPFNQIQKVVKIEGEVMFPGYYALETNEDMISSIIERAGGLTQYGYPEGAFLIRRTEHFGKNSKKEDVRALIEVKRKSLIKEHAAAGDFGEKLIKFELDRYERMLMENVREKKSVHSLEARIFRAQRLKELQPSDSAKIIKREGIGIELVKILKNPGCPQDLILREGDLISIPRKLQTVRIQGEVLYPNNIRFEKGMNFRRYISFAGGYSNEAKPSRAYVVYANGSAKQTRKFLWFKDYPPVLPGADVIIPRKKVARKVSPAEILGITSSLTTIALIIDRLTD